jgi:Sulfotransferase family
VTAADERLVFVFSLPRSGSTLLQRLLGAHPDIATASEPWILLPYLYTLREQGIYAEYGHRTMVRAVNDFCGRLPGGRDEYLAAVRELAGGLYASAAGERRYFLDKSPRYHLVAPEIVELFPRARFVFLWRQPLAVAASMIESFGGGDWNLQRYSVDLFEGVTTLLAARDACVGSCIEVRFEDVVRDAAGEARRVFDFLELPDAPDVEERFSGVDLGGRMGDRTGTKAYRSVSAEPLQKWTATLRSPARRWWARRYLDWLGGERLAAMGYDLEAVRGELAAAPAGASGLAGDVARMAYGYGWSRVADGLTGRRREVRGALPLRRRPRG